MNYNLIKKSILCLSIYLIGKVALVANVTATHANGEFILKNDNVELHFADGKDFVFKSFIQSGTNILPANGNTAYPWQLTYRGDNGENPILKPAQGFYKGAVVNQGTDEASLTFTWNMVLKKQNSFYPVKVKVSLTKNSELPEWNIEASLPKGWVVTESEFPRIAVNHFSGAKAILPVGFGTEYTVGNSGHLQSRYPSCTGGMQLVMMHNANGTVYFSALDREGSGKIFYLKSEGNSVVFIQNVTSSYAWSNNGTFTLPWNTVLGYNKDNWQATAIKWYRPFSFTTPWGAKKIADRKIPDWVKNADMWLRPADATENTMIHLTKALEFFGKGVGLHWYYWHNYPFDTNYPDYFPAQKSFDEMIKKAQDMGAYVTPYINGRLWDPATDSYTKLNGKDASCRKADGTLYTEVYGSKVLNTVTCPASDIWQKVLTNVNAQILNELHTNGVYMDQIGCANSEPCYATNHNHAPGGGSWWPTAYRKVLTEMKNNIYTDQQAMTTEENAECYIDLFDMMLTVNSPHNNYTKMVPLYPLIYSDRCIYSGYTYIPWKLNDGSFKFITAKSLIWGSQLGWVNPELLMKNENKAEADFLKTLTAFRKKNHDIFLGGRFLGEVELGGNIPTSVIPNYETSKVVLAAKWENVKGKKAIIVVNFSNSDQSISLPDGKSVDIKALSALRIAEK